MTNQLREEYINHHLRPSTMDTLEKAYDRFITAGRYIQADVVDKELAASLLAEAKDGWKEQPSKDDYNAVFSHNYDVLVKLIKSFVVLDGIDPSEDSMFAYICIKHPELELDWEALEGMRLVVSSSNPITKPAWQMSKIRFDLYIRSLIMTLEKKFA